MASKETSSSKASSAEDLVSRLKDRIQKLTKEMDRLGSALGVPPKPQQPQPQSSGFERPNMTAEEKKAQREAKKNEKKARGAAANAKKDSEPTVKTEKANQQKGKQSDKMSEPKTNIVKSENANPEVKEASSKIQESGEHADRNANMIKKEVQSKPSKDTPVGKSSMKNGKNDRRADSKEVQFDLSANTIKGIGSIDDLTEELVCHSPPIIETASIYSDIHPEFLALSTRCDKTLIADLDSLCKEFIDAFRAFLKDWQIKRVPSADNTTAAQDLGNDIKPQLAFLNNDGRWPLPLALGNIVRLLKKQIQLLGVPKPNIRTKTMEDVDDWLENCHEMNFSYAYGDILEHLQKKLSSSHNILTYDWCPVVNYVLQNTKDSSVYTVVDAEMNGRGMRHVQSFVEKGLRCRYSDLQSIGTAMKDTSMVLLGCSAVLSNGCIAAPRGSVQVALTAKAFNVPLLVVAQSFKFVDKVQSYGRMALLGKEAIELLPSDLVTAIVTEIRILPPSSAPAVLKAKALDMD